MSDAATKLNELVEQAASKVVMLEASDHPAELEQFQTLLTDIKTTLEKTSASRPDIVEQIKTLSDNAVKTLDSVLTQQTQDASGCLERLNTMVSDLQGLIGQMDQAVPAPSASSEATAAITMTFAEDDLPLIIDFINESKEHLENAEAGLLELENNPEEAETLNRIFRSFHTIKGMSGFLNLSDANKLAHAAENLLDMARKGQLKLIGAYSDVTFASLDMLKTMLNAMEKAGNTNSPYCTPDGIDALICRLHDCAEGTIDSPPAAPKEEPNQAAERLNETEDHKLDTLLNQEKEVAPAAASAAKTTEEKIKVSTTRLDELINMTGELAVAQLMISEEVGNTCNTDSNLYRKVAHQNKIVRQLQELSMSMRMVTVQGVFQKMTRLVRDLSRKAGKSIDFVCSGEETELDRTIVDKITDPLIHMMRNSVDHGVETGEERQAKGKPPVGHVALRAYHQAGSIVIEISDDGRGLNRDKILKKALERGLITKGQELLDEDIYKMIFMPGFSTAEKVTDVSGRGVGMDVVRRNIEAIGGKIDIRTTLDKGTTFLLRLPLTLAIIDGQIVTLGQQRYIIPINTIVHSIRPTADQISTIQNRTQMVKIRQDLMPLLPLHKMFNCETARKDPTEGLLVVVEEGSRKACLQVDELLGQQQVVIKSISGLGSVKGVSGGAVMGDGQVSLILDIPGLIELAQSTLC